VTSTLNFLEFGEATNPPLVLIHGLYGDSSTVAPLARLFAERFRVIAVDALGHGKSPRPEEFTLEDQGRAVAALIESLGYETAAVLGVSMGSYVAAQTAIVAPERLSHLVLVVTKGHGKTSSVVAFAEREGFDLAAATTEQTLLFMASALWAPDTPEERRQEILAREGADQTELTPEERAAINRSLEGFDLRPALPSITVPTLVISGRYDGLNPPASGEEVAGLIPGARFEVYENSGHMLASEEGERLVADVTATVLG
jgi:3-oxoadipate enol-lactonase